MQPRAACRSIEHSCLVAFHDGCCDNDGRLVATYRSHALGNICLYESVLAAVVREGAVCLVAIRDVRCDNDDATFDSFRSYILGDV